MRFSTKDSHQLSLFPLVEVRNYGDTLGENENEKFPRFSPLYTFLGNLNYVSYGI